MKLKRHWPLLLVATITAIARSINLYGYPKFLGDEGIYVSQAWWLVNFGKLSPYTYWYDHAPFGWLQIGIFQKLTGGPFAFGLSVHSGRIFMVIVSVISAVLVYLITKTLTRKRRVALLASLLFALSPIAVYYHRQILLDNLQTLWFLASFYLLLASNKRLLYIIGSGLALGLSFLSKETAIVFLPIFIILLLIKTKKASNRTVSLVTWPISFFFLVGLFPLLALLKGEFFPSEDKVSLLNTVLFQAQRGYEIKPWQPGSFLRQEIKVWFLKDPIFVIFGAWTTILNLFTKKPSYRLLSLLSLIFIGFLARGGLTLQFYIIPLLPLFAISIALAIGRIFTPHPIFLALLIPFLVFQDTRTYTYRATANQVEAMQYTKNLIQQDTVLATDDNLFMDLKLNKTGQNIAYPGIDWYFKVDADPAIRDQKLASKWQNIEYMLINEHIIFNMGIGNHPFLKEAYNHSEIIKEFPPQKPPHRSILPMPKEGDTYADKVILLKINPQTSKFSPLLAPQIPPIK